MRWRHSALAALVTILTSVGCGQKADCAKLCEREASCAAEISLVQGIATPEQIERLSEDDRKLLADRQRDRCASNCASPTKPSSVHTKWRRCLEENECQAFAKCVYR